MKRVTRTVGGESADSNSKSAAQQADRSRAAANAWRQSIDQSVQSLRASLSSSTTIEEFGTGGIGGGEAYANYAQAIKSIYDAAWRDAPEDVVDDSLTTEVKVAIARDGRVISARIVTPSGNAALDRSVRRALDRVESVPPFPKGAKETERIYTIYFNLKAKRLLG
jgi:TonB family protein